MYKNFRVSCEGSGTSDRRPSLVYVGEVYTGQTKRARSADTGALGTKHFPVFGTSINLIRSISRKNLNCFCHGVRLSPLSTAVIVWPILKPRMMMMSVE
jgi:hypothetical protein